MRTRDKVAITLAVICVVMAITYAFVGSASAVELLAFGWAVIGVPAIMLRA